MSKKEKISELLSNPELVEKLTACKDSEEIKDLAKENGLTLTRDEAARAFEIFGTRELQDDELDSVAGGGGTGGGMFNSASAKRKETDWC